MKILVFSDTHGRPQRMLEVIASVEHDLVLHLGDCVADARRIETQFPSTRLRYIAGNDLHDVMSRVPGRQLFMEAGVVIFMTHGQDYHVRAGTAQLYEAAQSCGAGLVLYGHTHIAHTEVRGGITFFNPGSASLGRSQMGESWGLVEIQGGTIQCQTIYF